MQRTLILQSHRHEEHKPDDFSINDSQTVSTLNYASFPCSQKTHSVQFQNNWMNPFFLSTVIGKAFGGFRQNVETPCHTAISGPTRSDYRTAKHFLGDDELRKHCVLHLLCMSEELLNFDRKEVYGVYCIMCKELSSSIIVKSKRNGKRSFEESLINSAGPEYRLSSTLSIMHKVAYLTNGSSMRDLCNGFMIGWIRYKVLWYC